MIKGAKKIANMMYRQKRQDAPQSFPKRQWGMTLGLLLSP